MEFRREFYELFFPDHLACVKGNGGGVQASRSSRFQNILWRSELVRGSANLPQHMTPSLLI
jgi:hypothetical protein